MVALCFREFARGVCVCEMCACIGAPSFVFVPLKGALKFGESGVWMDGWPNYGVHARVSFGKQQFSSQRERKVENMERQVLERDLRGLFGVVDGKGVVRLNEKHILLHFNLFFSFVCCSWMSSRLWCSYYGFNFPLCVCTNRFAPFEQHTESILKVFSFPPRKSSHFVGIFVPGRIHRNSLGFKQNVVLFRK